MSVILVEGGRRLSGAVTVQGAKNSVLPILAATVLSGGVCCVKGCPDLSDVDTAAQIIRHLGGEVRRESRARPAAGRRCRAERDKRTQVHHVQRGSKHQV